MKNLPHKVLEQHLAVLGKTGSGKTSTAKLIIEQVVAEGARVCILDPLKSDWWGLISSADGKHPGLPFNILGGPRGHVPLHAGAGAAIGELVATGQLPLSILDMADFEPGGLQNFFTHFAPALIRKMRGILYLVVEEAHEFAPKERAGFGNENLAIHWAKKMATAGRSKGIRLIIATQRTQSLHNALLGSCETMIAHRLTAPADQEPVMKWLKSNLSPEKVKEVAASLASLKTGEAWVCSGEAGIFERIQFPRITTFDNSATPTDDITQIEVKTAAVDQEKLRSIVANVIEEARANDPDALKAEIVNLKREIRAIRARPAPTATTVEKIVERPVDVPMISAADLNRIDRLHAEANRLASTSDVLANKAREIHAEVLALKAIVDGATEKIRHPMIHVISHSHREQLRGLLEKDSPPRPVRGVAVRTESNGDLPKGERAILIACAQLGGCTRETLSVLTSFKKSTRDTYIFRLKQAGLMEDEPQIGGVVVTERGFKALGDFERLPTGRALIDHYLATLPDGEARIFKLLTDHYPTWIQRGHIDDVTGFSKSTRDTYLFRLAARTLIEKHEGAVRSHQDLHR